MPLSGSRLSLAHGGLWVDSRHSAGIMKPMPRRRILVTLASALASGCVLTPASPDEMAPPEEKVAGELYAAIWADLRSNAMIGNGNALAARWANAGSEHEKAPRLHIEDLLCTDGDRRLRCRFGLLRDGDVATYLGEVAPDRLACSANFRRADASDRWTIPRLPPGPNGGHSRITIECKPVN